MQQANLLVKFLGWFSFFCLFKTIKGYYLVTICATSAQVNVIKIPGRQGSQLWDSFYSLCTEKCQEREHENSLSLHKLNQVKLFVNVSRSLVEQIFAFVYSLVALKESILGTVRLALLSMVNC